MNEEELLAALRDNRWDLKATALALGVSRTSLYALIDESPRIRKASDLSAEEIQQRIEEDERELSRLTFQKAVTGLDNPLVLRTIRRDVARLKTILKQKQAEAAQKNPAAKDNQAMQQALKDKGYDPGPMDGVMGPRTKAALMEYQRAEGMTATGRWDAETAAKIDLQTAEVRADGKQTTIPHAALIYNPDGDVFVSNHPYEAGVPHVSDMGFVALANQAIRMIAHDRLHRAVRRDESDASPDEG